MKIQITVTIPDASYEKLITFYTTQELRQEMIDAAVDEAMDAYHAITRIESEKQPFQEASNA